MSDNSRKNNLFWGLTIIALIFGMVSLFDRLTNGHVNANYGSYIPWGLWVAGYIYLSGISAGVFLFSALVYVFDYKPLRKIGRLALLTSFATLLGGLLSIWMDLGHMGRVWRMVLMTNFGSVMGWMSWLYGLFSILLLVQFWTAMRADLIKYSEKSGFVGSLAKFLSFGSTDVSEAALANDKKKLKNLGIVGIFLAIAFSGSVGAIFGTVGARPYWNSGLTPIIFLLGGLVSGGALLTAVAYYWGTDPNNEEDSNMLIQLGKIVFGLLLFDVLLEYAEITVGLWGSAPAEADAIKLILFGHFWWVFWFIHVGMGIVLPVLLYIFGGKSPRAVAWAGLLIVFSFISVRLNIVIPGQALPELEGLEKAFSGPGLSFEYLPSFMEWGVLIFNISFAALVFLLGQKFLPVTITNEFATEVKNEK